jgi:hypothetical protein
MPADDEQDRGREILRAMQAAKLRERRPRSYLWFSFLLSLALIAAIVVLILAKRHEFGLLWQHLMRPDSLAGA